jgi:hypothetical protein
MQKYAVILNPFDSFHTEVYRADEADKRFDEIERALKSCRLVLTAELKAQRNFQKLAEESVAEADSVLAVTPG